MQLQNYTQVNIFKEAFEQTEIPTAKNMIAHSHNHTTQAGNYIQHQFNPYVNNEGTVLGKQIW